MDGLWTAEFGSSTGISIARLLLGGRSFLLRSLPAFFALLQKSARQVSQFQSLPHSFKKLPGVRVFLPSGSAAGLFVTSLLPYLLTSSFSLTWSFLS